MRFWDTSRLADDIANERVSSKDKIAYFVFGAVFYTATGYAALYGLSQHGWLFIYEAVVVCVITFAGAHRVATSYRAPLDGGFFECAYFLSIPLSIKATVAAWVAIYGGWWVISKTVPNLSVETEQAANAVTYWVNRAWYLVPFVAATTIALVYWQRLAVHVGNVVTKRGA